MKFGKRLQIQLEETLPEWRDYFLSYKPLKKRLKQLSAPDFFTAVGICAASPPHDGSSSSVVDETLQELRKGSAALGDGGDKPPNGNANEAASSKPASEIGAGNSDEVSSQSSTPAEAGRNSERRTGIFDEEDFINLINEELEKFNNFFLEKEEEYVIYLQVLSMSNICSMNDLTCRNADKDGDQNIDLPHDQLDDNDGILHFDAELEHVKLNILEGIQHFGIELV